MSEVMIGCHIYGKVDPTLPNLVSFGIFKTNIFEFARLMSKSFSNCDIFQSCLNPHCSFGLGIELTSLFLLNCPFLKDNKCTLLSTIN